MRRLAAMTAPTRRTIVVTAKRELLRLRVAKRRRQLLREPRPTNAVSPPGPRRTPDVSFVVPIYNSEPWLRECLSGLLRQRGAALEVICVDDGSTDGSRMIVEEFARTDPRVRLIEQANHGQSVARNVGVAEASGRYIAFVDSDDIWLSDRLGTLVRHADIHSLDVLQFDGAAFRDGYHGQPSWSWYFRYYQRGTRYPGVHRGSSLMAQMYENNDYRPHVGLYLLRAAFVRSIHLSFIEGIVHQDNPFTFRLFLSAERSSYLPKTVYARRIRPGSTITALDNEDSARGYRIALADMEDSLRRLAPEGSREYRAAVKIVAGVRSAMQKRMRLLSRAASIRLDRAVDPNGLV